MRKQPRGRNGLFGFLTKKQTTYQRDVKGERADLVRAAKAKVKADRAAAKARSDEERRTQSEIQDGYSYQMGARHKRENKRAKPAESFLTAPAQLLGRVKAHALASRSYMQGYKQNPAASGPQYRLALAVLSGKARGAMPIHVARELVDSTPEALRKQFSKRNPRESLVGQTWEYAYRGKKKGVWRDLFAVSKIVADNGATVTFADGRTVPAEGLVRSRNPIKSNARNPSDFAVYKSKPFLKHLGTFATKSEADRVARAQPGGLSEHTVQKVDRAYSSLRKKAAGQGVLFENPITHVSFTTDKRGRPIAYKISMPPFGQYQPYRMNLDEAKLLVSTGQAKAVPYRSSAADRRKAAGKNPSKYGYTPAERSMFTPRRWLDPFGGEVVERASLPGRPQDYITGTLFLLPGGQLWRAAGKSFKRMTKADGSLKAGESRYVKAAGENPGRRNPLQAAAALSERFHGRPATEVETVREKLHTHEDLTKLGDLVRIVIDTPTGFKAVLDFDTEDPLKIVRLGCSEDGKQLYFRGGDQEVNLKKLGMDGPKWVRDHMELGRLHEFPEGEDEGSIVYRTKKKFNNFRVTDWWHKAGEVSSKSIGPAARPVLVYDYRSKLLSLVGGRYVVKAPGIID